MRNRCTAWPRPGSRTSRWLGIALLALPLARPAAADEPAAPSSGYRLALLDVPPAPEQRAAAAVLVPAAYQAIRGDGRFGLASAEQVAAARAENQVSDTDLTYPDACIVGRAVGASHAILIGGYDLTLHSSEKKSDFKRAVGMVSEQPPGHGGAYVPPASRFEFEARATASIIVMDMTNCKAGEQAVIRARRESDVSVDDARSKLQDDFVEAVGEGLQKLFPLQALVRTPSGHGGVIDHGTRHGVSPGQYYAVQRAGRVVGHVHVDAAGPDSARVTLVRGVRRLAPGDRLTEHRTVRVWEAALAATPNLLERRRADGALGLAASAHVTMSQPVTSAVYGLSAEYLTMDDLVRWRAGLHYGWQLRIVPRRLFAHARLGVGAFWARQSLRDQTGQMYDTTYVRGIELLNGVGLKALITPWATVQAEIGVPLPLRNDRWRLSSDDKRPAPAEALTYPRPQRVAPMLSLALGVRF